MKKPTMKLIGDDEYSYNNCTIYKRKNSAKETYFSVCGKVFPLLRDARKYIDELDIPYCKKCGDKLGFLTSVGVMCSSEYIGGDLCHTCQIEHCLQTNCLACEIGKYPNCEHQELKKINMECDH